MGMIDELIQQHCPDGIKYKRISEFATVIRGGNFQKKDFVQSGKPCIHYGQIYTQYGLEAKSSLSFVNEVVYENSKKAKPNNIIMAVTSENVEDIGKCLVWMGNEDIAVSGHTAIIDHELNGKYLAYFFSSEQFYNQKLKYVHGTKVMEITPKALYDVVVPIPPLAVQDEIVKVLDKLSELEAKLEAELEAELEMRRKQFTYYKNSILSFGNNTGE